MHALGKLASLVLTCFGRIVSYCNAWLGCRWGPTFGVEADCLVILKLSCSWHELGQDTGRSVRRGPTDLVDFHHRVTRLQGAPVAS